MASQSVLVRFVFLREASGRAPRWNCSRRTGRERVGVEVWEADADGRHDIHEITRDDCACRATTPRNMIDRARQAPCKCAARFDMPCRGVVAHRFTRAALEDRPRPEWNREERHPCGAITFTRSPRCVNLALRSCVFVRQSMRAARRLPVLVGNTTRQTPPSPS